MNNQVKVAAAVAAVLLVLVCVASVSETADAETEPVQYSDTGSNEVIELNKNTISKYLDADAYRFTDGNYVLTEKIFDEYNNLLRVPLLFIGECQLDLNGFSIISYAEDAIVNVEGTLTIVDSKGGGLVASMKNVSDDRIQTAVLNQDTLIIEGGSFSSDYTIANSSEFKDASIKIDGGSFVGEEAIRIVSGSLTFGGDATIESETSKGIVLMASSDSGDVEAIINGGQVVGSVAAVLVQGGGDTRNMAILEVNGGFISSVNGLAISGNGSTQYRYTEITINDGTISSTNQVAIYHPQFGDLEINGGTITGYSGIQYCGTGTLSINGGTITGTGTYDPTSKSPEQGSGTVDDGAAISLISRGGGYQADEGAMSVTIRDGTFVSEQSYAILSYRFQLIVSDEDKDWAIGDNTDLEYSYLDYVEISGGDFISNSNYSTIGYDQSKESNGTYSVFGGTYKSGESSWTVPSDLLRNGYELDEDGTVESTIDAVVITHEDGSTSSFSNIDDALAAVLDGDTIVLKGTGEDEDESLTLADYHDIIGKEVILDLNGQTLVSPKIGYSSKNIRIESGSVLTINATGGGQITGTANNILYVKSGGTLIINGGTFGTSESSMINVSLGSKFIMNGGIIDSSGNYAINMAGEVEINAGTISAKQGIYFTRGTLTIDESDLGSGIKINILYVGSAAYSSGALNFISGTIEEWQGYSMVLPKWTVNGNFGSDVSRYVPDGYTCVARGEYWVVEELDDLNAVAIIITNDGVTKYYASPVAAANALENGQTLVILKPYSSENSIEINVSNVIIDLRADITNIHEGGVGLAIRCPAGETDLVSVEITGSNDSKISASTPVSVASGNSSVCTEIKVNGVSLISTDGGTPLLLNSNSRIEDNETNRALIKSGGFLVTTDDGDYVYGTAAAALKASTNNKALLLNNYEGEIAISSSNSEMYYLDLGGNKITYNDSQQSAIRLNVSDVSITITNGEIISEGTGVDLGIPPSNSDVTFDNITLILDRVHITTKSTDFGIASNGVDSGINLTLIQSSIDSPEYAIYFPAPGTLTIRDSTVTGGVVGIEIRAGTINVYGDSKITGGTQFKEPVPNGSGTTMEGVGLAVSQHSYGPEVGVNIYGGTFYGAYGLYEADTVAGNEELISVNVYNGSFSGKDGPIHSGTQKGFVYGGTIQNYDASTMAEYISQEAEINETDEENKIFTVTPAEPSQGSILAYVGEQSFSDISYAVNFALANGEDVRLVKTVYVRDDLTLSGDVTILRDETFSGTMFYPIGATLTLNGVTLDGQNRGIDSNGYLVYIGNDGNSSIEAIDSKFMNNQAPAVGITSGESSFTGCTFSGNRTDSGSNGSAIYIADSTVTISDSVFTGNASGISGGAILAIRSSITITDTTMTGNTALGYEDDDGGFYGGHGGAIYIESGTTASSLVIERSTITDNIAYGNGSVVYAYGGGEAMTIEIDSSTMYATDATDASDEVVYMCVNSTENQMPKLTLSGSCDIKGRITTHSNRLETNITAEGGFSLPDGAEPIELTYSYMYVIGHQAVNGAGASTEYFTMDNYDDYLLVETTDGLVIADGVKVTFNMYGQNIVCDAAAGYIIPEEDYPESDRAGFDIEGWSTVDGAQWDPANGLASEGLVLRPIWSIIKPEITFTAMIDGSTTTVTADVSQDYQGAILSYSWGLGLTGASTTLSTEGTYTVMVTITPDGGKSQFFTAEYVYETLVILFYNGQELIGDTQVPSGGSVSATGYPKDPVREGYDFIGWNDATGSKADLSYITQDMSVYAGWELTAPTVEVRFEGTLSEDGKVIATIVATHPLGDGVTFTYLFGDATVESPSYIGSDYTFTITDPGIYGFGVVASYGGEHSDSVVQTFELTLNEPSGPGTGTPGGLPGWVDDDDVWVPPTIVYEDSSSDDSTKVAACAVAAVAAAIVALILVAEYRKK